MEELQRGYHLDGRVLRRAMVKVSMAQALRRRRSSTEGQLMADYYQLLGVDRDADADTLKRAYRRLARQYHPDVNKDPGAEEKFKEIGRAYEVLGDPQTRARYDQFGEAGVSGAAGGMPDMGDMGGFADLFETFFMALAAQPVAPNGRALAKAMTCALTSTSASVMRSLAARRRFRSAIWKPAAPATAAAPRRVQALDVPTCGGAGQVRLPRARPLAPSPRVPLAQPVKAPAGDCGSLPRLQRPSSRCASVKGQHPCGC